MAAILGFQIPPGLEQATGDLYNLSDAMGEIYIAFSNSTSRFVLDNYPPYASEISPTLNGGTMSQNVPVTIKTNAITVSQHARSYLQDYYFRIHLNLYAIALGNILSEQTHYVEIWNAWFNSETLSTISNVGLSDLNIELNEVVYDPYTGITGYTPTTIPHIYNALESTQAIITIPAEGIPTLDGYYSFNFTGEVPQLDITGQRVILWPYNTLRTFTESRAYLTDVIQSRANEQRFALREVPRQTIAYDNIFLSEEEFVSAKQVATTIAHLAIAVPQWTDTYKVKNLLTAQTTIYFPTANLELRTGYPVVIWKAWNNWEIQEILSIYSDRIILKQGLGKDYTHAWISPIVIGYTDSALTLTLKEDKTKSGSLQITNTDCFTSAVSTLPTFQGLAIWNRPAILSGSISNKYSRQTATSEVATGLVTKYDEETYSRQVNKMSTFIEDQADLYKVRRLFDAAQGKYASFWLPTFRTDLQPLSTIASGTSTLKVTYTNLVNYPIKYIYILGKDVFNNIIAEGYEITAIVNNLDGTENIGFAVASTKTFVSIKSVSIMLKVRLDSDVTEYEHLGKGKTTINIAIKEVA